MRKAFAIARLMLIDTIRDRSAVVNLVLFPLLFTGLVGLMLAPSWGPGSASAPMGVPVALADLDQSDSSRRLAELLPSSIRVEVVPSEKAALEMVRDNKANAAIVAPVGFHEALSELRPCAVLVVIPEGAGGEGHAIESTVRAVVLRLRSSVAAADAAADPGGGFPVQAPEGISADAAAAVDAAWNDGPPVALEEMPVSGGAEKRNASVPQRPLEQTSVGFLVMFVMAGAAIGAGEILVEKKQGTWGRLLSTPTGSGVVLFGKLLGLLSIGWLQCAVLMLGGRWLFRVEWGSSPVWVWLVLTSLILASVGLGLLIAAYAKTHAQVVTFTNIVLLPTSMLAGVYWPFEIMPTVVQRVAVLFPQRHAVAALIDLIVKKSGPSPEVLRSCLILLGFSAAFLAFGARAVKYE
ncbi:MAG: ABC transporter permease [Clostridia bacterium]|nr:ABC transporter permease [Clostridia bacterium]